MDHMCSVLLCQHCGISCRMKLNFPNNQCNLNKLLNGNIPFTCSHSLNSFHFYCKAPQNRVTWVWRSIDCIFIVVVVVFVVSLLLSMMVLFFLLLLLYESQCSLKVTIISTHTLTHTQIYTTTENKHLPVHLLTPIHKLSAKHIHTSTHKHTHTHARARKSTI